MGVCIGEFGGVEGDHGHPGGIGVQEGAPTGPVPALGGVIHTPQKCPLLQQPHQPPGTCSWWSWTHRTLVKDSARLSLGECMAWPLVWISSGWRCHKRSWGELRLIRKHNRSLIRKCPGEPGKGSGPTS